MINWNERPIFGICKPLNQFFFLFQAHSEVQSTGFLWLCSPGVKPVADTDPAAPSVPVRESACGQ